MNGVPDREQGVVGMGVPNLLAYEGMASELMKGVTLGGWWANTRLVRRYSILE